ncbi:hypothetical protein SLS53_007022 [Cytospora paraplurivora]|uniref:DUF7730 domain-containing protein n=1 Tax=Cytospora paraplurivora TaxID=2898453 RepID=A0AAN9U1R7_9PEZI
MVSIAKHSKPKQASHENEHVVPLLPAERPRRLSEAAFARHDSSLRHYGLFGRLPLEVRQKILTEAYADAIDILYSTNEFHLSDAKLIRNLPRLILPQRLASIRALELLWLPHTELLTHAPGPPGPYDTEEARRWLCNTIPIMFPRLEKLHLSLSYYIKEPGCLGLDPLDDSILQAERIILGPVESMLLKLPHASRTGGLSVAIDATLWKVLLRKHDHMRTPGLRADVDCFAYHGRFWKRFPGQEDEDGDAGYWVLDDLRLMTGGFRLMNIALMGPCRAHIHSKTYLPE